MTKLYEQNNERLKELLCVPINIEKHIDRYEQNAINIGDLKRAIRYNWLRNAYKTGHVDEDGVFFQLMTIHGDSYVKEIIA